VWRRRWRSRFAGAKPFRERTDEPPLDLDMRLLSTRIADEFADLTVMALDLAQPARWEIGQRLLDAEASGAVIGHRAGIGSLLHRSSYYLG
jgi:hypothetical protein